MSLLVVNTCNRGAELALFTESDVIIQRSDDERGSAESLSVMLQEVLKGKDFSSITRIVFFSGPGSYTGLRVGAAFCQGLTYGLNQASISISTFLALSSTIEVSQGFLGLSIAASATDVFYCEFKNSDNLKFWVPIGEFQVIESVNLEDFLTKRKVLDNTFRYQHLSLDLVSSKLMFEQARLAKYLDFWLAELGPIHEDMRYWNGHLSTNKHHELHYIKAVAAKTLEERKAS